MLLIIPFLLIMSILVILIFVKHKSVLLLWVTRNMRAFTIINWARWTPPIIRLWWDEPEWYGRWVCLCYSTVEE